VVVQCGVRDNDHLHIDKIVHSRDRSPVAMIVPGFKILALLLGFVLCLAAEGSGIDIADRKSTDPLLVIKTTEDKSISCLESLLPALDASSGNSGGVKIHDGTGIPSYRRLWRKPDVLMVHPISPDQPGTIDFSKITNSAKGRLTIMVRKHPYGDHLIKVHKNGEEVEMRNIRRQGWEDFRIGFDHEDVVISVHATGWVWEHSFISYRIE